MFDVIVVGSGAAGTFSAYGLGGLKVLVLDVGKMADLRSSFSGNLYDLKKSQSDLTDLFVGPNFEGLNNINQVYLNPKLKAPRNRFIVESTKEMTPILGDEFEPVFSLAKGGMANGWGAGCFRYLDRELSDFPIQYSDLKPCYDEITAKIGIHGEEDDLSGALGDATGLLDAPPLPEIGQRLFRKYTNRRSFFNSRGLRLGRLRLAVLTKDHDGRKKSDFDNLDFFKPYQDSIYNPLFTLNELVEKKLIVYEANFFVESFRETFDGVEVFARNLKTGETRIFHSRKLVLAAGVINTAKIVMTSFRDFSTLLPLQENAISYTPFLDPWRIGAPVEKASPLSFLGLLREAPDAKDIRWCSIYGLGGPLRSEYLFDFPTSARSSVAAAKYLSSAMLIVQSFYPGDPINRHSLGVLKSGEVQIKFQQRSMGEFERFVIRSFYRIGLISHPTLCKFPEPGNSFHYACTFPMKKNPGKYETDPSGLLSGTKSVYISDSSNFSYLPAFNPTLTIMANALRISRNLRSLLPNSSTTSDHQ